VSLSVISNAYISLDRMKNRKVPSSGEMSLVLYYRGKFDGYKSNTKMSVEQFLIIHRSRKHTEQKQPTFLVNRKTINAW